MFFYSHFFIFAGRNFLCRPIFVVCNKNAIKILIAVK